MDKRIACICDVPGKVQHQRMMMLKLVYMPYLDVYTVGQKPDLSKYRVVYYANYKLEEKCPFKGIKLASVTSWKFNEKDLGKFAEFAVNNKLLQKELGGFLMENGVNTPFWKSDNKAIRKGTTGVGWVGNKDRKAKRYDIWKKIKKAYKVDGVSWIEVASKKGKPLPMSRAQLLDAYNWMTYLVVTSDSEGTPNPALEALSCGVTVIGRAVGNLPDMERGVRIVDGSIESYLWELDQVPDDPIACRTEAEKWDWSIKYKAWDTFFRRWL